MDRAATRTGHSLRAALGVRALPLLLGVQLANAVAVWVHVVAVQWMLTVRGESAFVISMAPAAMAVPFLLFALPLGVVVGYASREKLMVASTSVSALTALTLVLATSAGLTHPTVLLATVGMVGSALVVVGVSWQSLLPEVVGRGLVPAASLLDGAVFNVARAVGPLLAGIGLGLFVPAATFGLVAALFGGCALTLVLHQRRATPGRRGPRRPVLPAIGGALHFARHSPWTRRLLWRMTMFGLPASAMWALVSLVAYERFDLDSDGFGVMMALLGSGAVVGTVTLGPLRHRCSVKVFAAALSTVYAATLVALGSFAPLGLVGIFLVLGGVAWVGVQSTWMMLAHQALPDWVRPRIIALVLFLFQGTQALGSLVWGVAADLVGLTGALATAAVMMVISVAVLLRSGLGSSVGIEPVLADADASVAAVAAEAGEGQLVVRYDYRVDESADDRFAEAMAHLRLSRLRMGAQHWSLTKDSAQPGVYTETYRVASRGDLLEQETERLTVPEQRLRHAVAETAAQVYGPSVEPVTASGEGAVATQPDGQGIRDTESEE
ncbi:MFS transporter [Nocardioides panacisoli]|uniref:MFS transporter n=1 Tax=Nocardioides panacisoli TaxID=627624 RepID=UPI001C62D435|nr:MFS transporter [Nocardioides panacisoli]QYJ03574.1 MFS transporter [Nocardioides panacisoli]